MSTPRSTKKLVNVYRVVRVGIPEDELAGFVGDEQGGLYQVVLILLAVLVGRPDCASDLFTAVRSAGDPTDVGSLVQDLSASPEHKDSADWRAIRHGLEHSEKETDGQFVRSLTTYRVWVRGCPGSCGS